MTLLARILTVIGIAVVAYVVFFGKPHEVLIQEAAPPQIAQPPQLPTPKPTARPRPRPRPTPEPADRVTFQPENAQSQGAMYRPLQAQPQAPQTRIVRKAPRVYEWEASFNSALEEIDPSKRQERIDVAQTALNRRLEEIKLNEGDGSPQERQAIRNAQLGLNLLREEVGQTRR